MNTSNVTRRNFLKTATVTGLGASLAGVSRSTAATAENGNSSSDLSRVRPAPSGQRPVHDLTTEPIERVRVAVIGLSRGLVHVTSCLNIDFAEVVAVCDWRDDRAQIAASESEKKGGKGPAI